jgi:8-oxo-dGTP pyrophosphatase MutT (NUDIX family)
MTLPGLDAAWLQRLRTRLDRAPARPRAALQLVAPGPAPAATIGSVEPALARRLANAGLPLREVGGAWRVSPGAGGADQVMADIAHWLRANGEASTWRDELLAVTDEAGRAVAAVERAAVRPLGVATHAVHLVLADPQGDVWVQQRALDKATDPGLWDTAMGGLMAAGESIAQTLERETWEEAGLRVGDLQRVAALGRFTVRRPVSDGYMVEHIAMFEAVVPQGRVPVNQDGEVERFECVDFAGLVERLRAGAFTLEAAMILAIWLERHATARPT